MTAVGRDADDALYPLAFALVQKENQDNWTWFMLALKNSLSLDSGSTVTMMSDMQKVVVLELFYLGCLTLCILSRTMFEMLHKLSAN